MAFKTLDVEDLYNEISDLARDQGVHSKAEWEEVVDEVVEAHLDVGEIDLEQDTEGMKETLYEQWTNYKEEADVKGADEGEEDAEVEKEKATDEEDEESSVVVDDEDEEEDDDDDDYGDGSEER